MINSVLKMHLRPPISRVGDVFHFPLSVWSSLQHRDVHLLHALDATAARALLRFSNWHRSSSCPNENPKGSKPQHVLEAPSLHGHGWELCLPQLGIGQQGLYWHLSLHLKWSQTPPSAYGIWGYWVKDWEQEIHFCPCKYPLKQP